MARETLLQLHFFLHCSISPSIITSHVIRSSSHTTLRKVAKTVIIRYWISFWYMNSRQQSTIYPSRKIVLFLPASGCEKQVRKKLSFSLIDVKKSQSCSIKCKRKIIAVRHGIPLSLTLSLREFGGFSKATYSIFISSKTHISLCEYM